MRFHPSQLYQVWFPGESLWELWLLGKRRRPELLDRSGDISDLQFQDRGATKVLALPTDRLIAVPYMTFWSMQENVFEGAELYVRKKHPDYDATAIGIQVVTEESPYTRLRIDAPVFDSGHRFPNDLKPDLVCAAPGLIALPTGGIAIWKELGKPIVAFERDGETAYYEDFPAANEFEMTIDLRNLIKRLRGEDVIKKPKSIHLWNRTSPHFFEKRFEWPITNEFRPEPHAPGKGVGLRPCWWKRIESEIVGDRKRQTRAVAAGLGLLGICSLYFVFVFLSSLQMDQQVDRLAELRPVASRINAWKAQWKEVATAVDRDASVLEIWRRLFSIPSANEVRISRLQVGNDIIELSGEAKTIPGAMRFINDVSKHSSLASFAWRFEEPEMRNDGTAYFELVGVKL